MKTKLIAMTVFALGFAVNAIAHDTSICSANGITSTEFEEVVLKTKGNVVSPNVLEIEYKNGNWMRLRAVEWTDSFGRVTSADLEDKNSIGKNLHAVFAKSTGEKIFVRYNVHSSPEYRDGCFMGSECAYMRVKLTDMAGKTLFDFKGDNICDRATELP